jgi:hypothetical protein
MIQKYPVGLQDFGKIRTENLLLNKERQHQKSKRQLIIVAVFGKTEETFKISEYRSGVIHSYRILYICTNKSVKTMYTAINGIYENGNIILEEAAPTTHNPILLKMNAVQGAKH